MYNPHEYIFQILSKSKKVILKVCLCLLFSRLSYYKDAAANMECKYLFKLLFVFPSNEYPEVELLHIW